MKPSERLILKLNEALKPLGFIMKPHLDWPRGGAKQEDCCRWVGNYAKIGGSGNAIGSIASWDTIGACLRGFSIEYPAFKGEATIMVSAVERRSHA